MNDNTASTRMLCASACYHHALSFHLQTPLGRGYASRQSTAFRKLSGFWESSPLLGGLRHAVESHALFIDFVRARVRTDILILQDGVGAKGISVPIFRGGPPILTE